MSIYAPDERHMRQRPRPIESKASSSLTPALPPNYVHETTIGALTLQLLDGHFEDVIAATDGLIGALPAHEHSSEIRDLRILRSLAELDGIAAPASVRAPAAETALQFALRILPALKRHISTGSIAPPPPEHRDVRPAQSPSSHRQPDPQIPSLTRRETEILGLTAQGLSNRELAQQLWISEQTVKKHQTNLFRKLAARNRTEAVAKGRKLGILR